MKILHALLFTIAPIPFYHFSCAKRLSCVCLWSSFFIMSLPCNAPPSYNRFFNLTVLNEIRAKGCIPEKDWSILSKSSYRKSPPPVKRVVRRAGYKPLLLGQRLKALAFTLWLREVFNHFPQLRSSHFAFDSSLPLKGHSYYLP